LRGDDNDAFFALIVVKDVAGRSRPFERPDAAFAISQKAARISATAAQDRFPAPQSALQAEMPRHHSHQYRQSGGLTLARPWRSTALRIGSRPRRLRWAGAPNHLEKGMAELDPPPSQEADTAADMRATWKADQYSAGAARDVSGLDDVSHPRFERAGDHRQRSRPAASA